MVRALPYTLPLFMLRTNLEAAYADPSKMTEARCSRRAIWMLASGIRRAGHRMDGVDSAARPVAAASAHLGADLLLWADKDAPIPIRNTGLPGAGAVALVLVLSAHAQNCRSFYLI